MDGQKKKDEKDEKKVRKNSFCKIIINRLGLILSTIALVIGIKLSYDYFINNKKFFTVVISIFKDKNIDKNNSIFQKLKEHNSLKTKIIDNTKDKNYISVNSLNTYKDQEREKEFICPITQKIMEEPVITPYGTTYEKSAIVDWIKRYNVDFKTENFLSEDMLVTNHILKIAIKEYKESINIK